MEFSAQLANAVTATISKMKPNTEPLIIPAVAAGDTIALLLAGGIVVGRDVELLEAKGV